MRFLIDDTCVLPKAKRIVRFIFGKYCVVHKKRIVRFIITESADRGLEKEWFTT